MFTVPKWSLLVSGDVRSPFWFLVPWYLLDVHLCLQGDYVSETEEEVPQVALVVVEFP